MGNDAFNGLIATLKRYVHHRKFLGRDVPFLRICSEKMEWLEKQAIRLVCVFIAHNQIYSYKNYSYNSNEEISE